MMNAIVLKKPGEFTVEELPIPELRADEVLIRVRSSGICTNDIRDFRGDCTYSYPRIGGHEYCGTIERLGSGVNTERFALGQKVVQYIIGDCKSCYYCKRGEENICEDFPKSETFHNSYGISGYKGFAEFVTAKAEDLYVYPEDADFDDMAFTEPLACVINSIEMTNLRYGDDVLVIGGGTMGLLHVMAAQLKGVRVILSEPLAERREKAIQLGATAVIDPVRESLQDRITELTEGRGADVVFNTTALPQIAADAVRATAPGGTVVMFSSIHPNTLVPVDMGRVHSFQQKIVGAVSPSISSYHQAVLLIGKKILSPAPLLEAVFDYRDFGQAMETAMRPDTYKVLLHFGEGK